MSLFESPLATLNIYLESISTSFRRWYPVLLFNYHRWGWAHWSQVDREAEKRILWTQKEAMGYYPLKIKFWMNKATPEILKISVATACPLWYQIIASGTVLLDQQSPLGVTLLLWSRKSPTTWPSSYTLGECDSYQSGVVIAEPTPKKMDQTASQALSLPNLECFHALTIHLYQNLC